jgi:hypothetical protein
VITETIVAVLEDHLGDELFMCTDPTHQGWCCKCGAHNLNGTPEQHLVAYINAAIETHLDEQLVDRLAGAEHSINLLMRGATLKSEERRLSGKIEGIQLAMTYVDDIMKDLG